MRCMKLSVHYSQRVFFYPTGVNGGLSKGYSVRRPGSKDTQPARCFFFFSNSDKCTECFDYKREMNLYYKLKYEGNCDDKSCIT
jgi:hypothetical protein